MKKILILIILLSLFASSGDVTVTKLIWNVNPTCEGIYAVSDMSMISFVGDGLLITFRGDDCASINENKFTNIEGNGKTVSYLTIEDKKLIEADFIVGNKEETTKYFVEKEYNLPSGTRFIFEDGKVTINYPDNVDFTKKDKSGNFLFEFPKTEEITLKGNNLILPNGAKINGEIIYKKGFWFVNSDTKIEYQGKTIISKPLTEVAIGFDQNISKKPKIEIYKDKIIAEGNIGEIQVKINYPDKEVHINFYKFLGDEAKLLIEDDGNKPNIKIEGIDYSSEAFGIKKEGEKFYKNKASSKTVPGDIEIENAAKDKQTSKVYIDNQKTTYEKNNKETKVSKSEPKEIDLIGYPIEKEVKEGLDKRAKEVVEKITSQTSTKNAVLKSSKSKAERAKLCALAASESEGNIKAKSSTGALGFLQINEETRKYFGLSKNDLLNPYTSIKAAKKILIAKRNYLLKECKCSKTLKLIDKIGETKLKGILAKDNQVYLMVAYNTGEGALCQALCNAENPLDFNHIIKELEEKYGSAKANEARIHAYKYMRYLAHCESIVK